MGLLKKSHEVVRVSEGPMLKKISTALIAIWTAAATTACSLSLDISSKIAETQPIADIYTPAVGLPDLSFGGTGYVQHKISLDLDLPDNYGSITRDSDDNIYMIGNIGYRGVVRALNPDGSIKTDFERKPGHLLRNQRKSGSTCPGYS